MPKPIRMPAMSAQPTPIVWDGQKAVFAMAHLQAQAFKAMMRYSIESASFLKHRCEEDVRLIDDLAAAKDFGEALEVFAEFSRDALSDYSREAGKMAGMGSKVASTALVQVRKEAETAMEEMGAATVA